jgi:hypothetical protein
MTPSGALPIKAISHFCQWLGARSNRPFLFFVGMFRLRANRSISRRDFEARYLANDF